eukprot:366241-Chlamydomonas_euryale.AAC.13
MLWPAAASRFACSFSRGMHSTATPQVPEMCAGVAVAGCNAAMHAFREFPYHVRLGRCGGVTLQGAKRRKALAGHSRGTARPAHVKSIVNVAVPNKRQPHARHRRRHVLENRKPDRGQTLNV